MEYAKDSEFIKDFISRTKRNIDQGRHPFEVTQLINSLVGLLILPKERYYDSIRNNMVNAQLLRTMQEYVTKGKTGKTCSLQQIVRHMRNSVSHFHIECKADASTMEIDKIVFTDYPNGDENYPPNFQIELPVTIVNQFVNQFSDAVVQSIMLNEKTGHILPPND